MCTYASELKNSMCNYLQYYSSYRDFFVLTLNHISSQIFCMKYLSADFDFTKKSVRVKYVHNMKHLM